MRGPSARTRFLRIRFCTNLSAPIFVPMINKVPSGQTGKPRSDASLQHSSQEASDRGLPLFPIRSLFIMGTKSGAAAQVLSWLIGQGALLAKKLRVRSSFIIIRWNAYVQFLRRPLRRNARRQLLSPFVEPCCRCVR